MEFAPFEEETIVRLLSEQFTSEILLAWIRNLEVTKRDFNGYGYYLHFRDQNGISLGKTVKPNEQKSIQGWYTDNNEEHHIGFVLWMSQNGEHQLECHPYDDKPILQSILNTKVTIT